MVKDIVKKHGLSLPFNPSELLKFTKTASEERARKVNCGLFIDPAADDSLIEEVRLLMVAQTPAAKVRTIVLDGSLPPKSEIAKLDFALVVAGPLHINPVTREIGKALKSAGVEYFVLTREQVTPAYLATLDAGPLGVERVESYDQTEAVVARWAASELGSLKLALSANFEFMRYAIAHEVVSNTALQNGVIGGVVFVPGADLPLMTLNQLKMLLQLAAAYGEPLDVKRVKEGVVVVGAAFLWRALARQLLTLIPVGGWAIKAGVGYGGTYAVGIAALEYFAAGGRLAGLGAYLSSQKDEISRTARSRATLPAAARRHDHERRIANIAQDTKRLYIRAKGASHSE